MNICHMNEYTTLLPELPQSMWDQLKALSRFLRSAIKGKDFIELVYYIPEGAVDYSTGIWQNMISFFSEISVETDIETYRFVGELLPQLRVMGQTFTFRIPTNKVEYLPNQKA